MATNGVSETLSQDNTTLIDSLHHLDAGITIFNSQFSLIASNHRFRQMLDFPERLCVPGVHLSEFFRFNAERGEYGPGDVAEMVESRMEVARRGQLHRSERARPDGTVIEVRGNTLPDGGLITIYTDVTDSRRHQAELEEARRTLERRVDERTRELAESRQALADKTRVLETVVEHVRHGISVFGADLRLAMCNQHFLELLRMPPEFGEVGTPFEALIRLNAERGEYGPGDIEALVRDRMERVRAITPHRFERMRPDGTAVEVIGVPLPEGGFVTTYTDITERMQAERALRESEERLRGVLEAGPIGICIIGQDDGRIRFCNQRMAQIFGVRPDELVEARFAGFLADPERWEAIQSRFNAGSDILDEEVAFSKTGGEALWVLLTIRHILFQEQPSMLLWIYEVTDLREARERMTSMAYHDTLTGLANRRSFMDSLPTVLSHARRNEYSCALLYCDLDGFKQVNDTHGHDKGDVVLEEVANRLRACVRRGDIAARLGGDEFAVVIESAPPEAELLKFAAKIISRLSDPIIDGDFTAQVGVSIGIAVFDGHASDIESIIRAADRAMYEAKRGGKGCVRISGRF
ncbi:MAG: PAS-domain containing protein [Phaeospirillum sp.]|nr:PAS-domain containing protein [Phaeospirillum sp.]